MRSCRRTAWPTSTTSANRNRFVRCQVQKQLIRLGLLDASQVAELRELKRVWRLRDRDLLLACEGACYSAVVQEIARYESEYQAAYEAILTAEQLTKRRELIKNRGMHYVSRYPF